MLKIIKIIQIICCYVKITTRGGIYSMINIAICDDDLEFLTTFEEKLIKIFKSLGIDIYINKFQDSLKFIQDYEKNFYNLIFFRYLYAKYKWPTSCGKNKKC